MPALAGLDKTVQNFRIRRGRKPPFWYKIF